jgi:hypothetical protein
MNEAPASAASKNIESACELMKAWPGDLQAGNGVAGSLIKDRQTEAGLLGKLDVLGSNPNRHGPLMKVQEI